MSPKYNLILLLTFLSFNTDAQEYSNRWKETRRTGRDNKPVAYTDTMLINSVTKESLKMRKGSFEYIGTISNDLLEVGEDQYQVVRHTETEISIGDENYIHIFSRELKDRSAAGAAAFIKENELPSAPVKSIDRALLNGKWQTYKRQKKDGSPGKVKYGNMVKALSFTAMENQMGYDYVLTDNGSRLSIKSFKDSDITVIDDNKAEHRVTVWKLTKEELVIEDEDGFLYYMKQF